VRPANSSWARAVAFSCRGQASTAPGNIVEYFRLHQCPCHASGIKVFNGLTVLPQATAVPSQREHDDQSEVEVFLVAPTAAGTAETDEHPSPMGHGPWPASLEFGIIDQAPKRQCVRTCPNS